MSDAYDNSRCGELIAAISARQKGGPVALKDAPDEVKCLAILTMKACLFRRFPELHRSQEMADFNAMLIVLAPDLFEAKGDYPSPYNRISRLFFADLDDLRNGKLDNPPL